MKQFFVFKLIPVMFLSGALLAGCSDEPSCPDGIKENTLNIYAPELGKVPYSGNDELRFKNASGEVETYVGTGKQDFTETESFGLADPACGITHKTTYQAYKISFLFNGKNIHFEHSAKVSNGSCYININSTKFDVRLTSVSNNVIKTYSYLDSLLINDNFYYKVSAISNVNHDTLYMNETNGILMLKSVNAALNLSIVK